MKKLRVLLSFVGVMALAAPSFAGWGSAGGYGSSGGYYGAGYGSSGGYGSGGSYGSSGGYGYSASYGSSGGGYSAGYGSSGGYAVAAAYGSSGGAGSSGVAHVGPLRRLAAKVHAHHANRVALYGGSSGGSSGYVGVSHGSSGGYAVASHGSSGGYGSSGGHYRSTASYGSSGGHGSSGGYSHSGYGSSGGSYHSGYGSTGSSYGGGVIYESAPMSSGSIIESAPTTHSSSTDASHYGTPITRTSGSVAGDEIHLLVDLPESARVFVNGKPTTSTGSTRRFVSRNLDVDSSYRFEVRAEQDINGRVVTKNQTVVLTPGSTESIAFAFEDLQPVAAETVLRLNVPSDAKVTLAGNSTKSLGETRTFRTKELAAGEVWNDYKITVSWNGLVKEKSIRLIGGDELSVSFGFDDLAAN